MKRLLCAIAVAFVVLGADQAAVSADTTPADPQQQLAVIDQIRAQLGSNLADAIAAQQQLRQSLQDNAVQQQEIQAKVNAANERIADLEAQIAEAQRHEAILGRRIEAERAQLRQLARAAYVSPESVLVVLAESQSLADLLTRISDLNVAGSRAAELKSSLHVDLLALTAEREHEQAARDEQVKLRALLHSQLAQLQALQAQQQKAVEDLQVKIDQTRYEISRLNTQSAQLAQAVTEMLQQQQDAIIAAAMQAVWAQLQLWLQSNNVGQIPTSAGHSTQYRFIWPEPTAQISQRFGPTTYWFEPPYAGYSHFHTGIDLVAPFGSPVYAADDGVVALVGTSSTGYGNYVVIAHSGGLDTLYGHLSTSLVHAGQTVTQGTAVGLEGSTGNSTGAHLHFELRIGQRPVDPTPYLPPGPPSAYHA
ncbi:MAG TPA: peptidoglycan DD-metalloendopeptidase family protein [Candidatus Dormibacteraeota bacterium]|nr:peptidoglycan DD-metalloendopeptidase family protein [Candidatus Dormibacteraeota bacterium]